MNENSSFGLSIRLGRIANSGLRIPTQNRGLTPGVAYLSNRDLSNQLHPIALLPVARSSTGTNSPYPTPKKPGGIQVCCNQISYHATKATLFPVFTLKPRPHERFFARAGDAIFSNFVASPARDENRTCSHPRTCDATGEKIARKKSPELKFSRQNRRDSACVATLQLSLVICNLARETPGYQRLKFPSEVDGKILVPFSLRATDGPTLTFS